MFEKGPEYVSHLFYCRQLMKYFIHLFMVLFNDATLKYPLANKNYSLSIITEKNKQRNKLS